MTHRCYGSGMTDEIPDDAQVYITTDAQQLIKAIRNAAILIVIGLITLGVLIAQPWATPKLKLVEEDSNTLRVSRICVVYKNSVDCRN